MGRGILLDIHRWRLANDINMEIFKDNSIPVKYLKAVAESQGTEIKWGDILIVRVGMYRPSSFFLSEKQKNKNKRNRR